MSSSVVSYIGTLLGRRAYEQESRLLDNSMKACRTRLIDIVLMRQTDRCALQAAQLSDLLTA